MQNNCCNNRNTRCVRPINRTIYNTILGATGPTGATGATGPTGPTGATGPAGTTALLDASINRNDNAQVVTENSVVDITGTNVLTNLDGDLLFVNNMVQLRAGGVYLINATVEVSGTDGTYNMAIDVGGTDYKFVTTIANSANSGTVSHTIFLNIANNSTTVAIYDRTSGSTTIEKAELDIIKLA